MIGKTPLSFCELAPGNYNLIIKKDSFTVKNILRFPLKQNLYFHPVLNSEYGIMNFTTSPSGAKIFLNDSLIGQTPLKVKIPTGRNEIKFEKEDFKTFTSTILIPPAYHEYFKKLDYKWGKLKFDNSVSKYNIKLNGSNLNFVNPDELKIEAGNHLLEFENFTTKEKIKSEIFVNNNSTTNIEIKKNAFTFSGLLKSIIIPGWGQFSDDPKIKGVSILGSFLTAGAVTFIANNSYNEKQDEYKTIQTNYYNAVNELEVLKYKEEMKTSYNSLYDYKNFKNISTGILIGVYAYNLLDVLVFHSTKDKINVSYQKENSVVPGHSNNSINLKIKL